MLELFDMDCRAATIKMLQQAIINSLETKENTEKLSKYRISLKRRPVLY